MNKNFRRIIGGLIGVIYLSSLAMECYLVDGESSNGLLGLMALLVGWLNFNIIGMIWLANPLFLLSLFLFFSKKIKLALILSLIASILAISFLQIEEIIINEAGHTGKITEYLIGYWLWTSTNLLLFLVLIINNILEYRKTKHHKELR